MAKKQSIVKRLPNEWGKYLRTIYLTITINTQNNSIAKPIQLKMTIGLNGLSFKGRHTNGQWEYKKYSASLIIREMHIKITMKYQFSPVKRVIIKKTKDKKSSRKDMEKKEPLHTLGGNVC